MVRNFELKMNKESLLPDEAVVSKIYLLRGQKVMLDRDLAELYDVKPIRLREQVKRNKERFPDNFMFQLDENEVETLLSQNAIPSRKHLGGSLSMVTVRVILSQTAISSTHSAPRQ